jgi:hypothetical protein
VHVVIFPDKWSARLEHRAGAGKALKRTWRSLEAAQRDFEHAASRIGKAN